MTMSDLSDIQERFALPPTLSVGLPSKSDRACLPCPKGFYFYQASLEAGCRLPFPPLVREVLRFYNLAPGQLAPNAWRYLLGCAILWGDVFKGKVPLSLDVFAHMFRLKGSPSGQGWWYFTKRPNIPELLTVPHSNKEWRDRFFYVEVENPSEFHPGSAYNIHLVWGTPHSKALHFLKFYHSWAHFVYSFLIWAFLQIVMSNPLCLRNRKTRSTRFQSAGPRHFLWLLPQNPLLAMA